MAELEKKSLSKVKSKKVIIISVVVLSIAIASIIIGFYVAKPYINYNNAIKYLELGKYDDAIELFQTLNDYKDSKEKVIEAKYLKAKSLMDNGDYKTSYDLFNELAGYKDCEDLKIECIYQQAVASVNDEDFRNARSLLDSITNNNKNDYKNSKELYEKCDQLEKDEKLKIKYDEAKKLYDGKEYYKSAYLFYELKNEQYKDSEDLFNESVYNYYINYVKDIEEKVNNDEEIIFEEDDISVWVNELIEKSYKDIKSWNKKFSDLCDKYYSYKNFKGIMEAQIGDIIKFGNYENKEIEWYVIGKKNNKILVITKDSIKYKEYNDWVSDVTWETCTLRKWLNNEFYNSAFSKNQKSLIETTNVVNNDNMEYGTKGGNNTKDKVFLLSVDEVYEYFTFDEYFIREEAGRSYYPWWLRSPGYYQYNAAWVGSDGNVGESGRPAYLERYGVRPVLWINLNF